MSSSIVGHEVGSPTSEGGGKRKSLRFPNFNLRKYLGRRGSKASAAAGDGGGGGAAAGGTRTVSPVTPHSRGGGDDHHLVDGVEGFEVTSLGSSRTPPPPSTGSRGTAGGGMGTLGTILEAAARGGSSGSQYNYRPGDGTSLAGSELEDGTDSVSGRAGGPWASPEGRSRRSKSAKQPSNRTLSVADDLKDDDVSDVASTAGPLEEVAYWSEGEDSRAGGMGVCGNERCVRERQRLQKVVDELRHKADTFDDVCKKYMSEILDLRQQVAMLSGRHPGSSSGTPYVSNYEVLQRDNSMMRPGPFATQRIQHSQRINPKLIIKELDIVIEKIVGVGSFGKVWKGTYNGRSVAIKCFYSEDTDVVGEINLMERVNGKPHVLPLEGVYLSNDTGEEAQVALVTPYMANGSLYDVLINTKAPQYRASIPMTTIVKIAMQVADGVRSLHQENIIHRDLACRNVLVDENLDVYVSDFGFARQKENKTSKGFTKNVMGPVKWEAPESLQRKEYSEKTDAFSFGVCLYEMVAAKEPWEGETHGQVAYQVICGNRLPISLNCDPVIAEIMQQCWEGEPHKRPNFEYIHRRLKERHTQLLNEEREIMSEKQLVMQLRQGTTFYKLPYLKGSPHKRQFRISEDLRRLKWCFLPTRNFVQRARDPVRPAVKAVFLSEIQDIRMGMRTANFRRIEHLEKFRGRAAFSIITHDRTLDILCPTPEIMDQWVFGLRFLVGRLQPSPSTAPSPAYYDQWTIMARLRRGGFLLKFGHNGKPHERYFRVAGNMKMMFWTSGENPVKGVHKSVDLTAVRTVRLLAGLRNTTVGGKLGLGRWGWEDVKFGFSLLGQNGQAIINLVAANKEEFDLWTRGMELIVHHFQGQEEESANQSAHRNKDLQEAPIYDRGNYLEFAPTDLTPSQQQHLQAAAGSDGSSRGPFVADDESVSQGGASSTGNTSRQATPVSVGEGGGGASSSGGPAGSKLPSIDSLGSSTSSLLAAGRDGPPRAAEDSLRPASRDSGPSPVPRSPAPANGYLQQQQQPPPGPSSSLRHQQQEVGSENGYDNGHNGGPRSSRSQRSSEHWSPLSQGSALDGNSDAAVLIKDPLDIGPPAVAARSMASSAAAAREVLPPPPPPQRLSTSSLLSRTRADDEPLPPHLATQDLYASGAALLQQHLSSLQKGSTGPPDSVGPSITADEAKTPS